MKKAQGLPLNVVILSILVLVVLVVLIVIFTGKTGDFAKDADSCLTKGGTCKDSCADTPTKVFTEISAGNCKGSTPKCCIKLYDK